LYNRSITCLCISKYTESILLDKFPSIPVEKIKVLYVPIDYPDYTIVPNNRTKYRNRLEIKDDDFVLLQVSRIVDRKGHRYVMEAISKMDESEKARIKYIICGRGPLLEQLQTLANDLRLEKNVKMVGFVNDDELPAYYDACDVFVMPSIEAHSTVEGFGIVFLEAALRDKPSIGSKHGAVPEVVINGITGLLVEPENSNDLADKICIMARNKELVYNMGTAARIRTANEFSCQRIASNYRRMILKFKSNNSLNFN
jgi:phosphatidylinositol alpha-1,6-mannosyltransferase